MASVLVGGLLFGLIASVRRYAEASMAVFVVAGLSLGTLVIG
ncbi:hypothetical protein [Microbacterium pygmaeum]|nr:hypothetical protein [Microbacterium pygmaeum]